MDTPANETKSLLNERQAAEVLGISVRTAQDFRLRGSGPPFIRLTPKLIRYRYDELIAWLDERVHRSTRAFPL